MTFLIDFLLCFSICCFLVNVCFDIVFTMFPSCPHFAATLCLDDRLFNFSYRFSSIFATIFHPKSMKKWIRDPVQEKLDFGNQFYWFLVDFWSPLGPLGGTNFSKSGCPSLGPGTFFSIFALLDFIWTLLGKKCVFDHPQDHNFWSHFE